MFQQSSARLPVWLSVASRSLSGREVPSQPTPTRLPFDIVFFDDNSPLSVPKEASTAAKFHLARAVVIKHLQNSTSKTAVLTFNNLDDPDFTTYLHDSACCFALCSDGLNYKYSKQKSVKLHGHTVEVAASAAPREDHTRRLRSTIWALMNQKGLDVALPNGLTFQDSKVFAFVLERKFKSESLAQLLENVVGLEEAQHQQNKYVHTSELQPPFQRFLEGSGLAKSSRLTVTLSILQHMPLDPPHHMVIPHVIHLVYLESVPLNQGCFLL
jgi:hypothetical protein